MRAVMRFSWMILLFCSLATGAGAQTKDAQLWTWVSVDKDITKNISGALEQQVRLDRNMSFPKTVFTEAGLAFRISKMLRYTASYRFIGKGGTAGGYLAGHRFTGDLRIKWKRKPLELAYNNKIQREFRAREGTVQTEDYNRNKLTLALDLDRKFKPYIAFEAYYHLDLEQFDKNRYTLGVDFNLKNRNELAVFYRLQQSYNTKDPALDFIIGVGFSHAFKGAIFEGGRD